MTLIHVESPALHDHRHAAEVAGNQLPGVPQDGRHVESRDPGIGYPDRARDAFGETTQSRSEHDGDAGTVIAEPLAHCIGGEGDRLGPRAHSRIPAMAADRKLASVPASMARNPSRARSPLRFGASAPMPPIWIPTDEKF